MVHICFTVLSKAVVHAFSLHLIAEAALVSGLGTLSTAVDEPELYAAASHMFTVHGRSRPGPG